MTGLHNTDLTTSQKIEFSAKALANQGLHGSVTQLSEEYELSRPTIYHVQKTTEELLSEHFNQTQEQLRAKTVLVDQKQLERTIIALSIMSPNSIRAIEDLLPIIYPGVTRSFGSIQSLLIEAQEKARVFNDTVDLSQIKVAALDEMYSQNAPVLAGVDLASGYLPSLELCESRSSEDWEAVLERAKSQGLDLEIVVKDAALGIACGVKAVFPHAQQRDDCFHVLYDMNKVRRKIKSHAYNAIENEYSLQKKLAKLDKQNQSTKDTSDDIEETQKLYIKAQGKCQEKIEQFELFETAAKLIIEAMQYVHPETGELYSGSRVEMMMKSAANALRTIQQYHCQKLATYIDNRATGIAYAAHALDVELAVLTPQFSRSQVSRGCLLLRLLDELKKQKMIQNHHKKYQFFQALFHNLQKKLGKKLEDLLDRIRALLEKRYRASSAIEGFNSVLRPYLYLRKGVNQSFLELFKAWYNLRTRRQGRYKGTSAHECISGQKVDDWLSMIGYPPSSSLH